MTLREKIFEIVQPAASGNLPSKVFDVTISGLVFLSVAAVFAGTFTIPEYLSKGLRQFEIWVSIIFTVEYLIRILTSDMLYPDVPKWKAPFKYMKSGMAVIDLLAILPFYLPMLFPCNMVALRMFRLFRLLRIFKLNRYFDSLAAIGFVLRSRSRELLGSMFVVGLLLVISSLFIYAVEHDAQPESFKNAFSGLWWAVATLTTVGYGDIYPITALGRLLGAVIAILGIGMVAIPTGIISSGLIDHISNQKCVTEDETDLDRAEPKCVRCPHCGKKIKKVI